MNKDEGKNAEEAIFLAAVERHDFPLQFCDNALLTFVVTHHVE